MRATTGIRAAMEALRHFGARRVVMASPYPERHDRAMADYLSAHGFEIVSAEGLDVPFKRLQAVPPADIKSLRRRMSSAARRLATPSTCPARNGRRRRPSRRWSAISAFRRSVIPTRAFSPPSRRSASRNRSRATAGCWPRSRMPRHDACGLSRRFAVLRRAAVPAGGARRNGREIFIAARPSSLRSPARLPAATTSPRARWPITTAGTFPAIPPSSSRTCRAPPAWSSPIISTMSPSATAP